MNATSDKLPTLYIPHGGGPCFFMDWSVRRRAGRHLGQHRGLAAGSGRHPARSGPRRSWSSPATGRRTAFTAASVRAPSADLRLHRLPAAHLRAASIPLPARPALAQRIVDLLTAAGLPARTDPTRGFDHGIFIPFLLIYPDADIPVVPLSLKHNLDPAEHLAAGRP